MIILSRAQRNGGGESRVNREGVYCLIQGYVGDRDSFIYSSFILSLILSFIHSFTRQFVNSLKCLFVFSFIGLFIYSFIRLLSVK